jgi:hypothetical protein
MYAKGEVVSRSVGALAARSITTETFKRLVGKIGATTDHQDDGERRNGMIHTMSGLSTRSALLLRRVQYVGDEEWLMD